MRVFDEADHNKINKFRFSKIVAISNIFFLTNEGASQKLSISCFPAVKFKFLKYCIVGELFRFVTV